MSSSAPTASVGQKRRRGERNPVHEQRRGMIHGRYHLPTEVALVQERVRKIFQEAEDKLLDELDQLETRDEGRVTAALDQLSIAANVACESVVLPHVMPRATKTIQC